MFDNFEFNGTVFGITVVFWLIVVAAVWKFQVGEGTSMFYKIFMTVLSLPVIFFAVNWQVNK